MKSFKEQNQLGFLKNKNISKLFSCWSYQNIFRLIVYNQDHNVGSS